MIERVIHKNDRAEHHVGNIKLIKGISLVIVDVIALVLV